MGKVAGVKGVGVEGPRSSASISLTAKQAKSLFKAKVPGIGKRVRLKLVGKLRRLSQSDDYNDVGLDLDKIAHDEREEHGLGRSMTGVLKARSMRRAGL